VLKREKLTASDIVHLSSRPMECCTAQLSGTKSDVSHRTGQRSFAEKKTEIPWPGASVDLAANECNGPLTGTFASQSNSCSSRLAVRRSGKHLGSYPEQHGLSAAHEYYILYSLTLKLGILSLINLRY
jgi:hypothetical protein